MDDQTYQFYKFYYNDFKRELKIESKLETIESIIENFKEIRSYIRVYENLKIEENLSKFKIFYACTFKKLIKKKRILFYCFYI
jgi:hypothetical protein